MRRKILKILLIPVLVLLLIFLVGNIRTLGQSPTKDEIYTRKRNAEGVVMVQVDSQHQVWTQKIGTGNISLLLLHGGPGATHEYFENFPNYLDTSILSIYFYDQLGSFFSDNPNSKAMWLVDRFVEEVETVRKALNLKDFYILGHSWGGILALEYAVKYQHQLKGLLISNGAFTEYGAYEYRGFLWQKVKEELKVKLGRNPKSKEIRSEYERIYRYGLDTIPAVFERLEKHYNRNSRIRQMFKKSELFKLLPEKVTKLELPVLIIGGTDDFIDPNDFELMHKQIPNSELVIIPNAPHFAMWSDPVPYFRAISEFIKP